MSYVCELYFSLLVSLNVVVVVVVVVVVIVVVVVLAYI